MTSLVNPNDSIERQNEKLTKIIQALMRKVEQKTEESGLAYHQFERAALLESEVQQRTRDLERTLDLLHESNALLDAARHETERAWSNLTEAIETINEGFALFDENDCLVLFNSRFCRDLEDVVATLNAGLTFQDYVRTVSQSRFLALPDSQSREGWSRLRQEKHRQDHVVFNVSLASDRWLQVSERRTSRNGTVILQTDVTDIIRMERLERDRMRHQEAVKLQATLDHLNQGVCIFDRDKLLVGTNKRMVRLMDSVPMRFGQSTTFGDLLDQLEIELSFNKGISPQQLRTWVESAGFRDPIAFEATTRRDQIYSFFAQEMPDKGFVISVTDVTPERIASRALSEMNEKLEFLVQERTSELEEALSEAERANASKSRFVAAASHDLLQPLSAAKLFVSSIANRSTDDVVQQVVRKTETALEGAEQIIEALLAISRLDAGKAVFDIQTIRLTEIINPLRDELSQIAKAKGVEFRFLHSSLSVISDPGYLRRIVQNLLSNAIRYTSSGRVLAGIRRVGDHARIEVWDTGCGIAEADRKTIFAEFKQVRTNQDTPGLGLGLAIVERACKGLDHPLGLWSEPNVGSCFTVTVPVARPKVRSEAMSSASDNQTTDNLGGLLVLLVENNPHLGQDVSKLVESHRGEVIWARDADEALRLIEEIDLAPDAMLLDYQLGSSMDGLKLHDTILRRYGPIPTAIISAHRTAELVRKCDAQCVKLLQKPLGPEQVISFLNGHGL